MEPSKIDDLRVAIYVLKLENRKFYIGISRNVVARLKKYSSNSQEDLPDWVKENPFIEVVEVLESDIYEAVVLTLSYMRKYGVENIRGCVFREEKLRYEDPIKKLIKKSDQEIRTEVMEMYKPTMSDPDFINNKKSVESLRREKNNGKPVYTLNNFIIERLDFMWDICRNHQYKFRYQAIEPYIKKHDEENVYNRPKKGLSSSTQQNEWHDDLDDEFDNTSVNKKNKENHSQPLDTFTTVAESSKVTENTETQPLLTDTHRTSDENTETQPLLTDTHRTSDENTDAQDFDRKYGNCNITCVCRCNII